ncbi:MAG: hypothetical protein R3D05_13325 [Dongiaceae bacterium]
MTLIIGCVFLASVPQTAAQSFGSMSMLDLESARDSFFQSADHDGDFALSSEEQLSAMGASHSNLFECWDEDGDGVCSYTEFLDAGEKIFNELDVNGDGRLSPDEVQ